MGRNIIVLLFWNTIWFYHVLVRESSMSSWGAGFDQSFKMPTSFRIVSSSWGTKTICFWKPSAISSLRKRIERERSHQLHAFGLLGLAAVECTGHQLDKSPRLDPDQNRSILDLSGRVSRRRQQGTGTREGWCLLGNSFRHKSVFPNRSISPLLFMYTNSYFFSFLILLQLKITFHKCREKRVYQKI